MGMYAPQRAEVAIRPLLPEAKAATRDSIIEGHRSNAKEVEAEGESCMRHFPRARSNSQRMSHE